MLEATPGFPICWSPFVPQHHTLPPDRAQLKSKPEPTSSTVVAATELVRKLAQGVRAAHR